MPKDTGIGASSKRREDVRFLSGLGNYTDDVVIAGQSYAIFVRSTVAHGRIVKVATEAAAAMPGVTLCVPIWAKGASRRRIPCCQLPVFCW